MKGFVLCISILLFSIPVFSSEKELMELAGFYYDKGEYYGSITESMRYQFLYPRGIFYPQSMLLQGKSCHKGGDSEKALSIFSECYSRFTETGAGEAALLYSGLVRLDIGSYTYAARNFQEYNYVYNKGIFLEDSLINLSLAYALAENYNEAEKKLGEYKKVFPHGKLEKKADELSLLVTKYRERPKKSLLIAGLSSAIIPGSGYFYTGNYMLGIFSLLTNGALIYGIYDGYKKDDKFQMIFFSVIEFSFYNYSIVGSIKSADEFNEGKDIKREMLIGIKTAF